jgi:AP-2 complex subunit sigma-1
MIQELRNSMLKGSEKVYAILDEVFLAGEIEETSKQVVLTRLEHLDKLE